MPRSGTDSSGRERAPRIVTALAAFTATLWISGCASVTNTPAQDLAWGRWHQCSARFPTALLRQIRPDGQISFSYRRATDLRGMNECLEQAAATQQGIASQTANPGEPGASAQPPVPPAPAVVAPHVAYTFRIIDDPATGTTGNGDGRIQRGETVRLLLDFKNVSPDPLERVSVDVASPVTSGFTLDSSRIELGALRAEETRSSRVVIAVRPNFPANELPLRLTVRGAGGVVLLEDELRLAVDAGPARPVQAVSKQVVVAGSSAEIRSGVGAEMPVIALANQAQPLAVTGELGEWYRLRLSDTESGWIPKREVIEFRPAGPTEAAVPTVRAPAVIGVFQNAPPVIVLASPVDGQHVTADRVQLIGGVGSANGIARIEISVNGQRVAARELRGVTVKPTAPAGAASVEFSERIPVKEGLNQISVTAVDGQNLTATRMVTVARVVDYGQVHAVVIGISRYRSIRSLRFADRDATAFAEYLEHQVGVPRANITLLLNEQATLVNLKRALGTELKRRAAEKDTAIVFYAGHGAPEAEASNPDDDGLEKYLVPHDGDSRDLYTTALPMREVETIFQRLSAERVVFITDACYSGATAGRTFATASRRALVSDNFLVRLSRGKGRVVLTASRASEVSEEREDLQHGVFTYYLLEGLRGKADLDGDGVITVEEAYAYVSLKVPAATGQNQHPIKKGEVEGQLILGRTR